jgi:hypothetical protein
MNKKFDKIPDNIEDYVFQFNDLDPHTLIKSGNLNYIKCRNGVCSSNYTEREALNYINSRILEIIKSPELVHELW